MSELRGHEPHCYYETEDCTCGYALQEARRDVESLTADLAVEREKCAALAGALRLTVAAMKFGADIGCVEDLDACDDGGEFWHNALRRGGAALVALDAEEKTS